jgi:hypothetical protein
MNEYLINKSLILPLKGDIRFYDNITGKSIENTNDINTNYGFIFHELVPFQISYNEQQTCHKYVCRSLWYPYVSNVMINYPISKYYCIFLDGLFFVVLYDDVLQIVQQTSKFYITPMITYDTMLDLTCGNINDIVVIDEMYVIDEDSFQCKTCAIKLNGLTLEQISNLPTTLSTYGQNNEYHNGKNIADVVSSSRFIDKTIRNSKIVTKNLIIDIDLNNHINDDSTMIPCDNFEYIEYSKDQHFSIHTDRKRNPMHTHTILIYPPTITSVEGGELKLYPHGTNSMISITIKMSTDKWIGVIFPIDIPHESLPISNSGIKKIFKTTGSIVKTFDN